MPVELTGRIREGTPTGDPSQWEVASEAPADPWKVSGQQRMGEYLKAQGIDATPKPEDVQADETTVPGGPPSADAWKPVKEEPFKGWGDIGAAMPEAYGANSPIKDPLAAAVASAVTLPKRAIEGAAKYVPGSGEIPTETIAPAVETALNTMGTGAIAGVPARAGEAVLGAGLTRKTAAEAAAAAATKQVASKLADDLQALRQSSVADRAEVGNIIRALPKEATTPAIGEKLYHAAEDPALTARLTPEERAINDQHLAPLRQEQASLAKEATDLGGGNLVDDPNYMHRIAKGHAPAYDSLSGDAFDPVTGTRGLPRTTSALQERKFYVAESPTGTRKVVSQSPDGVTVWNNKTPTNVTTSGELIPGETIDLGGKPWTVKQATTKEIEQHTATEYHKNAFVNTADAVVRLREVVRNLKFVEEVKKSPWWLDHAQQAGGNRPAPKGWREPLMPQFKGWKVDPKIADVLDDFYQPGLIGHDSPFMALRNANQFFTGAMFWQPIPHIANVGVHWVVGRGWDWVRPGPMRHFVTDMSRAMKAVVTQNRDYQRFLRGGGGLVSGGVRNADFYGDLARQLGMDVEKNWSQYAPLAKKLGIKTPHDFTAWYYSKVRSVLWQSSDLFMMHRYLELERKGYSTARAIRDAEKHIPNYRIPTHIMFGQNKLGRMASKIAQEPALALFMRYRYGQWRSYVNMMTDIAKGSPEEKKEALGNAAALAVMGFVVYEALDAIYQKITGDPNAKLLRRGAMTAPHHLAEVTRGNMGWSEFLQSEIPMAGVTKEVLQQMFGRDLFTGAPLPDAIIPRAEHAAKTLLSPYGTAEQALPAPESKTDKYGKEKPTLKGRSAGRLALDTVVGGANTSERTLSGKEKAKRMRENAAANAERNPQGIIDRAYYGAKHAIFGKPPVAVKPPKEKKSHHNKEKGY